MPEKGTSRIFTRSSASPRLRQLAGAVECRRIERRGRGLPCSARWVRLRSAGGTWTTRHVWHIARHARMVQKSGSDVLVEHAQHQQ